MISVNTAPGTNPTWRYANGCEEEGCEEGREEGRKNERKEIICKMLESTSKEEVSKLTGLSLDEIEELIK